MKHVAIYVRVSTKQQDQRSQEPDLKRWAASQDEPVQWYRDHFTGRSMERPAMTRLLSNAASAQVSRVVVWRLDRLGRTARGLTALFEELAAWKVDLVSLRDGLDLSTPAGRLMANVLASVAAYETEVRAERVLADQAAARAAGKRWGGSKPGRKLHVTSEQEATAKRLRHEGEKIARPSPARLGSAGRRSTRCSTPETQRPDAPSCSRAAHKCPLFPKQETGHLWATMVMHGQES